MPEFVGSTYDPERDHDRLAVQLNRVRSIMSDGRWYTLNVISMAAAAPMQSVSARIRDLRKPKHGGYTIERRYVVKGVWEYRMVKDE